MKEKKIKQLKNIGYYFFGTFLSVVLGMLSTPILTRILSKEVYAQYGMITSFTTALSTFIYLGLDESFMRYFDKRKETYWSFLIKCMKLPMILCFIVFLLVLEPNRTIMKNIIGTNISTVSCILFCVYLFVMLIQRFLLLTARMEERAANYSLSNVATKGVFLILIYLFLYLNSIISIELIILSLVVGALVAMFINLFVLLGVQHKENKKGENVTIIELLKYGFPLAVTFTLAFTIPLIEKMIIRNKTNWEILAIYTSASIFMTVMNMVKTTVSNIWVPYAYKNHENGIEFKKIFYYLGTSLAFFMLCIVSGTILTRRWLVLILDKSYLDALTIAPAIVCGSCFDVLSTIYSIGIYIKKRTSFRVIIPFIRMIISFSILYFLLPKIGLKATGLSYLMSIAISITVEMKVALDYYDTNRNNFKTVIMMFFCTLFSVLALYYKSLKFDVLTGTLLFFLGTIIARKELFEAYKWLRK